MNLLLACGCIYVVVRILYGALCEGQQASDAAKAAAAAAKEAAEQAANAGGHGFSCLAEFLLALAVCVFFYVLVS